MMAIYDGPFLVSIVIGGSTISLCDGTLATLEAHDGLGGAPLTRLRERGPMQHGERDVGYRLDPRAFTLRFGVEGSSRANLDTRRSTLLSYLAPARDITLEFKTNAGREQRIDCHAVHAPMPHDAQRYWGALPIAVQFRAADPRFYTPGEKTHTCAPGDSTAYYYGTFWSLPHRVRITGPITDPIVTNNSTDEKLDFTGVTIASGSYYDVDCRYGYKTVEDDGGVDRRYQLTDDSDLASFHLGAEPEVEDGENAINVAGSGTDANTEVGIAWYERFIGVFGIGT
jgi:hypothetical protein